MGSAQPGVSIGLPLPGVHHLDLSAEAIALILGIHRSAIEEDPIVVAGASIDIAIVVFETTLMLTADGEAIV